MPDHRGRAPRRLGPKTKVWLAFFVLAGALMVLTVGPVLVSFRTRALRHEITEVAEPTIAATSGIERAVGRQISALRGYALTADPDFLDEYRRLDDQERESARRLLALAGSLGPDVTRHADRLLTLATRWDRRVERALERPNGPDVRPLVTNGDVPSALLEEARTLRRAVELLQRLRRSEIASTERLEVGVNLAMVVLATTAGGSLLVIGRRLQALRREAEERQEEIRRSQEARARLTRGLGHDLKNPLGAAAAHAEFLKMEMKGALSEGQRESVTAIERSVGAAIRMVEDLVHLARAEGGGLPVEPVVVDLAGLVAAIGRDGRMKAEREGLELQVETPSELEARTDPVRVREVVENLLSNAIRYTPSGGTVRLTLTGPDDTRSDADDARVRISVSDTGPGVAAADQERIFDEFERAGADVEGSGLGLAISRRIALLLGGDIELESARGRGARFTLVLPREPSTSDLPPATS